MQALQYATTRRISFSLFGVIPAAAVVALSMQACSAEVPDKTSNPTTTNYSPTDPSCRPTTCATLGKNCGILNDGCGGTVRCGTCAGSGNDCRNNVCMRGCSSNAECGNGASCINGSCSDKCSDSSSCPSGQYCSNGSCAANAATTCRYDAECRADERCTNNVCVGTGNGTYRTCRSDSECRGSERCTNGSCSTSGARTCRYHEDCGVNETCTNGYCSSQGGTSCTYDNQCSYGERCSYGVCRRQDYGTGTGTGRVRAECYTRGITIPLPFGQISFGSENWLYDDQNPNGVRVDSCTCPPGEYKMHISDAWGSRDIPCNRCVKDGDERTCYE